MPPQQPDAAIPPAPVEPVQPAPPILPPQPSVVEQPVAVPPPTAPIVVETPPPVSIPPQPALQEIPQPVIQPEAQAPEQYVPPAAKIMFEGETQTQQIQSTGMMQWIIANSGGAIKDEKQAMTTLLGVAGVAVLISLYLIFFTGPSTPPPPPIMDDSFVPLTEKQDFSL